MELEPIFLAWFLKHNTNPMSILNKKAMISNSRIQYFWYYYLNNRGIVPGEGGVEEQYGELVPAHLHQLHHLYGGRPAIS